MLRELSQTRKGGPCTGGPTHVRSLEVRATGTQQVVAPGWGWVMRTGQLCRTGARGWERGCALIDGKMVHYVHTIGKGTTTPADRERTATPSHQLQAPSKWQVWYETGRSLQSWSRGVRWGPLAGPRVRLAPSHRTRFVLGWGDACGIFLRPGEASRSQAWAQAPPSLVSPPRQDPCSSLGETGTWERTGLCCQGQACWLVAWGCRAVRVSRGSPSCAPHPNLPSPRPASRGRKWKHGLPHRTAHVGATQGVSR